MPGWRCFIFAIHPVAPSAAPAASPPAPLAFVLRSAAVNSTFACFFGRLTGGQVGETVNSRLGCGCAIVVI